MRDNCNRNIIIIILCIGIFLMVFFGIQLISPKITIDENIDYLYIAEQEERLLTGKSVTKDDLINLKYTYLKYLKEKSNMFNNTDNDAHYVNGIFELLFQSEQTNIDDLKYIFDMLNVTLDNENLIDGLEKCKELLQKGGNLSKYVPLQIERLVDTQSLYSDELLKIRDAPEIQKIEQLINKINKYYEKIDYIYNAMIIFFIIIVSISAVITIITERVADRKYQEELKIRRQTEVEREKLKQRLIKEAILKYNNKFEEKIFVLKNAPEHTEIVKINENLIYTGLKSVMIRIYSCVTLESTVKIIYTMTESGVKFWVHFLQDGVYYDLTQFTQSVGDMYNIELNI